MSLAAPLDTAPDTRALARDEMTIARRHMTGFPVVMAAWGLGNLAVWLSLWPLVLLGHLPLWAGFLVATFNVMACYHPSHEAQHSNYAQPGQPLRWLNELIGYVSTIPMGLPFKIARITHLDHHTYTNNPLRDPDYGNKAPNWWRAVLGNIAKRQPGRPNAYGAVLRTKIAEGDQAAKRAVLEGMAQNAIYLSILTTLAWSGHAIEAALLWWLPKQIGSTYISLFLSWFPHHPMEEQGRYRNTRHFHYGFGNVVALGIETHIIHHLHPGIPLNRQRAVFNEMRPILEARGCRLDET
ncbi:MAG: fatty acid desaturase [Pseudomonadota bacterium]